MQVLYIEFKPWNKLSNLKQKNFPEKKKKKVKNKQILKTSQGQEKLDR